MKQFSLEEYLKNPNRKVVTRDGRPVRIIYTDKLGATPVVALFPHTDNKSELVFSYTIYGKVCGTNKENGLDLMFAPTKKEGWINLYRCNNGDYYLSGVIYSTEQEAKNAGVLRSQYGTTTKIEWEE